MKTIIFDFDGTLTQKHSNVWKLLWQMLNYDVSINSTLCSLFMRNKITYEKWVNITCCYFKKAGMNKVLLNEAIKRTKILDGCLEFFMYLKSRGYNIHIVSGGIKQVIEGSLSKAANLCTSITSNEFVFDDAGKLKNIIATPFDYDGKARYIQKLIQEHNLNPNDILFIGNSDNDEFVHTTGCKTLCINAETFNHNNSTIWNNSIEIDSLTALIPIVEKIFEYQEEK